MKVKHRLLRQIFLIPLALLTVFMWHGNASAHEFDLHLTWTDLADNEDGFEIERSATGENGPFEWIDTVEEDVTSYTDSGLIDHIPYCYRVLAFNAAGNSASTVACALGAANSPPIAKAGPDQIVLTGELVSFNGSGSSDPDGDSLSYTWAFGDGATASGTTPEHTYLAAGTYTATLTVSDGNLSHTDSALITVDSPTNSVPVADAGPDQIVLVGEAVFCDGSGSYDPDGDALSYEWVLGDGSMRSGATDEHIYLEPGTYTVTLTVWDTEGLSNSDSAVVVVLSSADALLFFENFETYNSGQDPLDWKDTQAGNSFSADQSLFKTATVGGTTAFGTTSTQTNIHSHYQAAAGLGWSNYTFSGRMYLSDTRGGIGVTFLSQFPANQDHYYRLRRYHDSGAQDFHLSPHGTSVSGTTHSGVIPKANTWYQFQIEVEDTGSQTEIRAKVWQEGASEPADFQIEAVDASGSRLTAGTVGVWSMADGGKYFDDLQVQLGAPVNRAPTAVLAVAPSSPVMLGTVLSFDGADSSDPDGDTLSYEWAFGDGAMASSMTTGHSYSAAGTYTVTLTVWDAEGLQDTATAQITVEQPNRAPAAVLAMAPSSPVMLGMVLSFDGSGSSDPDGDTLSYEWAFGDGAMASSMTTEHSYSAAGTYTVTLTVWDVEGLQDTATAQITVEQPNRAPTAVLAMAPSSPVMVGMLLSFDGAGSSDPDEDTLSYEWAFGDDAEASSMTTEHSYSAAGTYTVTLTVWDVEGLSSSDSMVVVVEASPDVVSFFENFETYNSGQDPLDWKDTKAGNSFSADQSLFKTATIGGTTTFGTTSTQTNIHSHYEGADSLSSSNYTFTGRMYLTDTRGGLGVTFLSQFPANQDHYYRLRRYNGSGAQDFHLSPHGTSVSGTTHSGVIPKANTWYQFQIEVEDTGSQTEIRAKVWQEGASEPADFQIEAVDASGSRLTAGTVGVWSMANGGKYFDDLQVETVDSN